MAKHLGATEPVFMDLLSPFNGSQLAKIKRVASLCPCHETDREEAVGLKTYNYTLKIRFLWVCEILAISWKIHICQ